MRPSSWRADSSHPGRSACADRQHRLPIRCSRLTGLRALICARSTRRTGALFSPSEKPASYESFDVMQLATADRLTQKGDSRCRQLSS
jgi:hypothetical protein